MDNRKLSAIVLAITFLLTMFSGCLDNEDPKRSPNDPPVADIQGPAICWVGDVIVFNASGSSDDGGFDNLTFNWNFGDKITYVKYGPIFTYSCNESRILTVNLVVIDGSGAKDFAHMYVTINEMMILNLSIPDINQRMSGIICWDVNFHTRNLTQNLESVQWSEIRIGINDSDGNILNLPTGPPIADDSASYQDPVTGLATDVEFWYVDNLGDEMIGVDDIFKITGLNRAYQGATVEIIYDSHLICTVLLPILF